MGGVLIDVFFWDMGYGYLICIFLSLLDLGSTAEIFFFLEEGGSVCLP